MLEWIQTNFPDIYKLGWDGQTGWLTHFNLTLYMTFVSFAFGGFMGLVSGLFLVLTGPRGVIANKTAYWIFGQGGFYLPCHSFYYLVGGYCSFDENYCWKNHWYRGGFGAARSFSLSVLCPSG